MSIKYTYQAPLTHRARGPGIVLVLSDNYADKHTSSGLLHLDPPPAQKWAEEGFCIVSIVVSEDTQRSRGEPEATGLEWAKVLTKCRMELEAKQELEAGKGLGLIIYESKFVAGILPHAAHIPELCCVVAYTNPQVTLSAVDYTRALLQHISGSSRDIAVSQPSVQYAEGQADTTSNTASSIITYKYILPDSTATSTSSSVASFVHPSSPNYNHNYATLAHTRTLTFLRTHIGGPIFDIEAIWEAHTRFEFEGRDVEGTMGTMVAEPYVNHIPTLTGGIGREALTSFYTHHFIHSNPDSTRMELVSRTIGPDRVVDEFVFEFVHDREIDWMLPGVPPTGKHVRVPFVAVVNVRGDKLYHEHIYWDQASVLVQIGILPASLAFPGTTNAIRLPVAGVEQADKMLDPGAKESNLLIKDASR